MINVLMTGDILLCEGSSIIAKGISLFTGSRVTHTANVVVINGEIYIIDAQRKGVHLMPYKAWKKRWKYNYTIYRKNNIINRESWEKHYILRALSQCGKKYDLGLLFKEHPKEIIDDVLNPNNENEISSKYGSNGKFVCSELTMYFHRFPEYWKFTPKMVNDFVEDQNNNFIYIDYVKHTAND